MFTTSFRNTLIVTLFWAILLTVLSLSGFFADFSALPPRIGLAVLLPLPIVLIFAFSRTGTEWLRLVPPQRLVYWQSFRILVEIVLWVNYMRGLIPVQMSFEGRNFDVLSGLLAIPVAYYCFVRRSWPRWIVVAYNIAGLGLLLNIIIISVLSMPTPLRYFHNEPANTLLGHFPYIFLPGILVPLAYSLHILSLRQLAVTT
ncbi:MAG TPA: hypothetical protein VN824_19385 [Puia sp.]|nr:hypothetical protein [Puia sp.]